MGARGCRSHRPLPAASGAAWPSPRFPPLATAPRLRSPPVSSGLHCQAHRETLPIKSSKRANKFWPPKYSSSSQQLTCQRSEGAQTPFPKSVLVEVLAFSDELMTLQGLQRLTSLQTLALQDITKISPSHAFWILPPLLPPASQKAPKYQT